MWSSGSCPGALPPGLGVSQANAKIGGLELSRQGCQALPPVLPSPLSLTSNNEWELLWVDTDGGSFGSPALPVRCREPDLVVYPLSLTGKSQETPSIKTPPYQPSAWAERSPGESWGGAQTWQSGVLSDESLILELKGPDWRATNPHVLLKQHYGQ